MAEMQLRWGLGMDVISKKNALPVGAVVDAVNVDIDRAGGLKRRTGAARVYSGGVHSMWTSEIRGQSFAVADGHLWRIQMPWQMTPLRQLQQEAPFSYTDVNGEVVCGSRNELLVIGMDLSVRRLGLERPAPPTVLTVNAGGMDAGRYGVAVAYMHGSEEGPLSWTVFVTLAEGQGLRLILPVPNEALPTKVRVYRTTANGDVLMRAVDVLVGMPTILLGVGVLGEQAKNQFTVRMPPGDFVRYWKGMLWTVRANYIFHSEPFWYGVHNPRFNFVPMQNAIRLFEPVEGGIFVGTKEGVFFLKGSTPQQFEVTKLGGAAPLKGTAQRIPAALLGEREGDTGEYVVMWLSNNGFVIGTNDGRIIEKQRLRIVLDGTEGAVAVRNRRVVAVVTN